MLTEEDVNLAVERTDGTTASFLKELIRRSVRSPARRPGAHRRHRWPPGPRAAVHGQHPGQSPKDPIVGIAGTYQRSPREH